VAAAVLGVVYACTLAPDLTLWDASELASAIHTFGIPHPPGTPLYVAAARAWRLLLPVAPTVLATSLFAAACTAAACGIVGSRVGRWLNERWSGFAAGVAAGSASSVWLNATETEVYAAALLLTMLTLWAGDRAGRSIRVRETALVSYGFSLAPALHLSALVGAPGAIVLAATDDAGRIRWPRISILAGAATIAAGVGITSLPVLVAGVVMLVAGAVAGGQARTRTLIATAVVLALGASALVVLLLRARHDPAINQGNPATLASLAEGVGRRQYEVAGLWPRQAPIWLQLGNVLEYADWQVALGIDDTIGASWWRTPATAVWALLALAGGAHHRRMDRRSWRAMLILLGASSAGVALYLNLKAGPSFGYGVLPDNASREARERDYFFALAFALWSAWAALGAVRLGRRLAHGRAIGPLAGVAVAMLPVAGNWRAMDRRRAPDAALARTFALAMLTSAPPNAVLFTAGDNDSYPIWYLQAVEGVRRDVTPVTTSLVPARWYREELARRFALYPRDSAAAWAGTDAALRSVATRAQALLRPVAVSVMMRANERWVFGAPWDARGLVFVRGDGAGDRPRATIDTSAVRAASTMIASRLGTEWRAPRVGDTGAARYVAELLRCPARLLAVARGTATESPVALDSTCNLR
jgi:hypothetical protein